MTFPLWYQTSDSVLRYVAPRIVTTKTFDTYSGKSLCLTDHSLMSDNILQVVLDQNRCSGSKWKRYCQNLSYTKLICDIALLFNALMIIINVMLDALMIIIHTSLCWMHFRSLGH